jgi:hypothetical protein
VFISREPRPIAYGGFAGGEGKGGRHMKTTIFQVARLVVGALLMAATLVRGAQEEARKTCQILDNPFDPLYEFGFDYVGDSDFGDYGSTALLELDADWDVAYFRDVLRGDIDMVASFGAIMPVDDAGVGLPNQMVQAALDAGWTWRYVNDTALQVRAAPGIYSDIQEFTTDALYMPFSVAGIARLAPYASGIAGLQIRPGFERPVMPIIGLAWKINDQARLEAGLPVSRFLYSFNRRWSGQAGFEWRSRTFTIDDDRERVTMEDLRLTAGAVYKVSDLFQVVAEVGSLFERKADFDKEGSGMPSDVNIESAPMLRFAMIGPF